MNKNFAWVIVVGLVVCGCASEPLPSKHELPSQPSMPAGYRLGVYRHGLNNDGQADWHYGYVRNTGEVDWTGYRYPTQQEAIDSAWDAYCNHIHMLNIKPIKTP
jgi:hypothetical protein